MSTFVIVVGIAVIVLVLTLQYAQSRQEKTVWQDFAKDDLKEIAPPQPRPSSGDDRSGIRKASAKGKADRHRELSVVRIEDESPDCRSFYFAAPNQVQLPTFYGGQYLLVSLPDPDSPGRQVSRCYSLSDGNQESTYRITVKRVPGGKMSNLLHGTVRVGDRIRVQFPSGRFHIGNQAALDDNGRPWPLNLIAAGIGITPMLSMLKESLKNTPERPVRLFYQLRDASNAPFLGQLRELATVHASRFRLFVAYSKPSAGDLQKGDKQGRMDSAAIIGAVGSTSGNFMICGPDEFMQGISAGLVSCGVPQEFVEYESFSSTKPKSKTNPEPLSEVAFCQSHDRVTVATEVAIRFSRSACDAVWSEQDASLLDTAERSGVAIESACRSGQCGSCIVRLLAGSVRYDDTPGYDGLESDEILACVAQPTGDLVVDA